MGLYNIGTVIYGKDLFRHPFKKMCNEDDYDSRNYITWLFFISLFDK